MKSTIEVLVYPAGEIRIEAHGFKGSDCERATRYLEEALGNAKDRVKKPEYFARNTSRHCQQLRV